MPNKESFKFKRGAKLEVEDLGMEAGVKLTLEYPDEADLAILLPPEQVDLLHHWLNGTFGQLSTQIPYGTMAILRRITKPAGLTFTMTVKQKQLLCELLKILSLMHQQGGIKKCVK